MTAESRNAHISSWVRGRAGAHTLTIETPSVASPLSDWIRSEARRNVVVPLSEAMADALDDTHTDPAAADATTQGQEPAR